MAISCVPLVVYNLKLYDYISFLDYLPDDIKYMQCLEKNIRQRMITTKLEDWKAFSMEWFALLHFLSMEKFNI